MRQFLTVTSFLLLLSWLGYAQEIRIPKGGKVIADLEMNDSFLKKLNRPSTEAKVLPGAYQERDVLEVSFAHQPQKSSEIGFNLPLTEDIQQGDVLLLAFYMRGPRSEDESGDAQMTVYLQKNQAPYNKFFTSSALSGKAWRHVIKPFTSDQFLDKEQTNLSFHLGYYPQTVQLAGIQLINYGKKLTLKEMPYSRMSYQGREETAWRAAAEKRIKQYRTAQTDILVVDQKGKPVQNAEVQLTMLKHSFGFGTASNVNPLVEQSTDGDKYREVLVKYFNKTTTETGLRWQNWFKGSEEKRAENLQKLGQSLDWLRENGIETRGHYLMWGPVRAKSQPEALVRDPEALKAAYFQHLEKKTAWVGNRVGEWDAINHIIGWDTTYADLLGKEIYVEVMNKARELCPNQELWVNEGQVLPTGSRIEPYLNIIQYLKEHNASPDGIGFMGHFRESSLTPPERVYEVFDQFAKVIPNLQLTEFDVEVGVDKQLQADYFRDILIMAYSHPAMQGIVNWGFWESRHWRKDAALWREDWSIKPAGQVWLDYVYGRWWTNESALTDAQGVVQMNAFKGDHELTVKANGNTVTKNITITENGEKITIQVSR